MDNQSQSSTQQVLEYQPRKNYGAQYKSGGASNQMLHQKANEESVSWEGF